MSSVTDAELQSWIDGLRSADPSQRDKAIRDLIGHAYDAPPPGEEDASRGLSPPGPPSRDGQRPRRGGPAAPEGAGTVPPGHRPGQFFTFAARQVRWVLLDLAPRPAAEAIVREPADATADPAVIAEWTDFHRRVEQLPEDERQVVDLHFYKEFTQAQVARLLGLHEKEVSRRWLRAVASCRRGRRGIETRSAGIAEGCHVRDERRITHLTTQEKPRQR